MCQIKELTLLCKKKNFHCLFKVSILGKLFPGNKSSHQKKKEEEEDQKEGLITLSHLETPARLQGMRHRGPGSAPRHPVILQPRGARRLWGQEQVRPFSEHLLSSGQVLRLGGLTALARSQ